MKLYLDENGNIAADLNIMSLVVLPKAVASYKTLASFERDRLIINQNALSQLKMINKVGEYWYPLFVFQVLRIHFKWDEPRWLTFTEN